MEAIAISKFARFAPRRVNQVMQLIRNKPVEKALEILAFTPKVSAEPVLKTLKSAIANTGRAKNPAGLKVKSAWIGNGPVLKRMRPGPMGRGMGYKRKMTHITVVVCDMAPGELKVKTAKKKEEAK